MKEDRQRMATKGEKVTVASKKGCVFINSVGTAPYALVDTKRGLSVVPSGFSVTTYSDGEWWVAETQVVENTCIEDNTVLYRFFSERDPSACSDWMETPTVAFKQANDRLGTGFKGGCNGQLIIGVTYPSLQVKIFAKYPFARDFLKTELALKRIEKKQLKRMRRSASSSVSATLTAATVTQSTQADENNNTIIDDFLTMPNSPGGSDVESLLTAFEEEVAAISDINNKRVKYSRDRSFDEIIFEDDLVVDETMNGGIVDEELPSRPVKKAWRQHSLLPEQFGQDEANVPASWKINLAQECIPAMESIFSNNNKPVVAAENDDEFAMCSTNVKFMVEPHANDWYEQDEDVFAQQF